MVAKNQPHKLEIGFLEDSVDSNQTHSNICKDIISHCNILDSDWSYWYIVRCGTLTKMFMRFPASCFYFFKARSLYIAIGFSNSHIYIITLKDSTKL